MHIKDLLLENIKSTNYLYSLLEKEDLLDSQDTLDWQDKLNEISCRYNEKKVNT